MSRFLRFLLTSYAPLAARHMLVDGSPLWPAAGLTATKPKPPAVDFSACIDIGGRSRRTDATSDGLTSLGV